MPQNWEAVYREAMLETDDRELMGKIDSAMTVLRGSLVELGSLPDGASERQCIADALRTLESVRDIELKRPGFTLQKSSPE